LGGRVEGWVHGRDPAAILRGARKARAPQDEVARALSHTDDNTWGAST